MTSSTSNPSSVKPLSAEERAAWAAHNREENRERMQRFDCLSFAQKLRALEANGRLLSRLRESAQQRPGYESSR